MPVDNLQESRPVRLVKYAAGCQPCAIGIKALRHLAKVKIAVQFCYGTPARYKHGRRVTSKPHIIGVHVLRDVPGALYNRGSSGTWQDFGEYIGVYTG